ncbi:isochorismatase family protein [Gordonia sp. TBRC 11910]|uniref:Isochorismatase family protein n=1 Tax=Gordonia asplenii TaxID=2725283 RepID=A0A848KX05_9ACTN|nr:isochorismatase family protein [Gordonia asplenii]NMO00983.1 isochorismatase family protein [Gordonia asplenii]
MAIPPIASYQLNELSPATSPCLDWKLDPGRTALIIHDMQRYFVDAFPPADEPLPTVTANIVALRDTCDTLGIPTILTAQPPAQHPARRGLLTDRWGTGIATDAEAAVIEPLAPRAADIQVVKWRYSAFARTDLRQLLAHEGRDQILITGIYAHIGIMLTAADAFMNDIQAFLVTDAVADFNAGFHTGAIDYVNTTCGIALSTADARAELAGERP